MSIAGELRVLRVKILQLCYDKAKGITFPIYINILAKEVEMNPKDEKLLGTIQYLDDKGFLEQVGTIPSIMVKITHLGIDEVEFGFPDLLDKRRIP